MLRWPDKIAKAVTFDVAFALNFTVGRTLRPLTDLERKVVAKRAQVRKRGVSCSRFFIVLGPLRGWRLPCSRPSHGSALSDTR
jgi:hypothetical protein